MKLQYLKENFLTDPDQIADWIYRYHNLDEEIHKLRRQSRYDNDEFTIDLETGEVTFHHDFDISYNKTEKLTSIPIKIKYVDTFVDIKGNQISTFENFPKHIGNPSKSVQAMSILSICNNKFTTYHNVHKHFQYIHNGKVVLTPADCMLSWLYVKGLKRIVTKNTPDTDHNNLIGEVLTHCLPNRDVVAAADALEKLAQAGTIIITDNMLDF